MTNGRIHRKLREHSSSNYAISCLGEQRERVGKRGGEGERRREKGRQDGEREMEGRVKKTGVDCMCVCVCVVRRKALKQQKEKGTCSRLASCSFAECGAVAFTRSQ